MASNAEISSLATQADGVGSTAVRLEEAGQSLTENILFRKRRNAGVSVSRLPPELLQRIFEFFVKDKDNVVNRYWLLPSLTITLVCRHWYETAIAHHQLWTAIALDPKQDHSPVEVAELFAKRSLTCLLDIRAHDAMDGDWVDSLLVERNALYKSFADDFIAVHQDRLRSLLGPWFGWDNRIYNHLMMRDESYFPHLENLDVVLAPFDEDITKLIPAKLPNLKALYCRHAPRSLIACLSAFSRLTSLSVISPLYRPDAQEWIRILKETPALVSLSLYSAFKDVESPDELPSLDDSIVVHLPLLEVLQLGGENVQEYIDEYTLLQFFGRCKFPHTAQVTIAVSYLDCQDFMTTLSSIASGKTPSKFTFELAPITSCYFDYDKCILYTTQEKTTANNPDIVAAEPERHAWIIDFSKPLIPHLYRTDSADTFISTFPLQGLQKISIGGMFYGSPIVFSPAGWYSFPAISELWIEKGDTALFEFLDADERFYRETSRHLLPELTTLTIDQIDLSGRADLCSPVEWLERMLSMRKQNGARISCLRIMNCTLFDWKPRLLQEKGTVERIELIRSA